MVKVWLDLVCDPEKQCLWHESRQGYGNRNTTDGREEHEVSLIGNWARRGGPQRQDLNKMHPNEKHQGGHLQVHPEKRSTQNWEWSMELSERACSENWEQILVTQDAAGYGEKPEEGKEGGNTSEATFCCALCLADKRCVFTLKWVARKRGARVSLQALRFNWSRVGSQPQRSRVYSHLQNTPGLKWGLGRVYKLSSEQNLTICFGLIIFNFTNIHVWLLSFLSK